MIEPLTTANKVFVFMALIGGPALCIMAILILAKLKQRQKP